MAAPTQLNITITQNSGGGISGGNVSAIVVNLLIPAGLTTLDSGNTYSQGQVSQYNSVTGLWSQGQTGFSSIDELVRNIFKTGGFLASNGTWYSSDVIQSIGYQ